MFDFAAGIFPSCRRMIRFAVHRDDGPLALEQVSEAENRAMLVLNVMCGSHCHLRMVKHFLRSCESVARVDLAAILFAQSVQRGL